MLLATDEIHIWTVQDALIQDPVLLSAYQSLLNPDEVAIQKRFHFAKHQHQSLITRTLVRTVLSHYAPHIAPAAWEFTFNTYGKPYLSSKFSDLNLFFNISHTDNFIVLAISSSDHLGVDVENWRRETQLLKMPNKIFSPQENATLFNLVGEEKQKYFYSLWTLKEAYSKALGRGLSIPLDEVTFSLEGKTIQMSSQTEDEANNWKFYQLVLQEDFTISIATERMQPQQLVMYNSIPFGLEEITPIHLC